MAENLTALDKALNNLESTFSTISSDRNLLIAKLKQSIDNIVLNPNEDSPRMTEVKLATLKALDDILKSAESSAVSMAKTQLQKKNDENSEATKQMVVEMLKQINLAVGQTTTSGVKKPTVNMESVVAKACEQTNHPISDDELSVPEVPLKEVQ
jgi:hypothetical protein